MLDAVFIYVLDWGYYDENWMQQDAGVYVINGSIVSKVVPDAIGMAVEGQSIVTYNFPYGSTKATYNVYNIVYGSLDTFTPTGGTPIEYPCAIAVDPNTGQVCIASRKMDPDTGYPAYSNMIFDIALVDFWHPGETRPPFKSREK